VVRNQLSVRLQRYEAYPNLGNIVRSILRKQKIKSFRQYHTNNKEEQVENCYEGGLGIANHPSQRKEE